MRRFRGRGKAIGIGILVTPLTTRVWEFKNIAEGRGARLQYSGILRLHACKQSAVPSPELRHDSTKTLHVLRRLI